MELTALSPLDGRYAAKTNELSAFFSEKALMHFRVLIEIRWLSFLGKCDTIEDVRPLYPEEEELLEKILIDFEDADALRIKEIEKETNHDVKAVEYFLRERFAATSLKDLSEWIHFGATSEDVNNLAYALMVRDGLQKCLLPLLEKFQQNLATKIGDWKDIPMLARTHGQPASPTTLGKVFLNFKTRLARQIELLSQQEFLGKWNGATGNFNAHVAAFPNVDWLEISQNFVESLDLTWQAVSDQIEPHDFLAEICHGFIRIDTILTQLARDTWGYISLGYFGQKVIAGEVGSSTMPHKVNPIDFENAEGNLGIANALFSFFAEKLPLTRWQRDLTDSTVLRNIGTAFGHVLLAIKSLERGLGKLEVRSEVIAADLEQNWEVLAEAVQTVMRRHGVANAYEQLKELTRGKRLTKETYQEFIRQLELPSESKEYLLKLTPETYTGIASQIVERFRKN